MSSKSTSEKSLQPTERQELREALEENVNRIQEVFANDDSLILRYFENEQKPDRFGCILYLEGMVKREVIEENIVKPVMEKCLPTDKERFVDMIALRVLFSSDVVQTPYEDEAISQLISGKTLLLFEGCREVLAVGTQNPKSRGITEPEAEKIMIGPREGFIELIMDNVTMLRRKLETPDLKCYFMKLGTRSQTKVCICHLEGIANTKILEELKKRLSQIEIDGLLSSNYIVELISDSPYSPFQTIGFTERPDVVAAKLLEGRIAVMVDGSPVVLTLPFLFNEYLQSSEDYYNSFYFTSINRLLRIIGLIITVSAPAVYAAILTYHQEIIPTPLLLSISAARQGIPFPTIIEVLLMLLFFEIMRETGIRMPTAIGQALSIVGALVLGQASVEAKFFSAPVVIVVALTGITGLILPRMKGAIITIRILLLIVSSFVGLYGYVFGITCVLLLLCSMRSFGVPYLMDVTSLNPEDMKDTAIRAPIWFMKSRSDMIARNRVRLKTHRGKSS